MDEPDERREADEHRDIEGDDAIGPLLRRLRGDLSLRDVTKRVGVSSSYLSEIERGSRRPGVNIIRKLADLYNVDAAELMKRAGRDPHIDPFSDEAMEVERAYEYVLADPVFRVGTRPDGPVTLKTKRFIVEMYERFANKRLLE
jgi:transcriptional regulator with XRE-family HTH domain